MLWPLVKVQVKPQLASATAPSAKSAGMAMKDFIFVVGIGRVGSTCTKFEERLCLV